MSNIYDEHRYNVQVPSGKGENKFAFGGKVQDKQFAQQVTQPDKCQLLLLVFILSITTIIWWVCNCITMKMALM